jgi:hypothetical protein
MSGWLGASPGTDRLLIRDAQGRIRWVANPHWLMDLVTGGLVNRCAAGSYLPDAVPDGDAGPSARAADCGVAAGPALDSWFARVKTSKGWSHRGF